MGGAEAASAQEVEPAMGEFFKAMQLMMAAPASNATPLVDFRELKALLPESLQGFERVTASGEKTGAMGMTISMAEAEFTGPGYGKIEIKISDHAGLGGLMAFAHAAWTASEIDRETDTGFERTTTYGAHKAHEVYDRKDRRGEIQILVADRFNVAITGRNVSWDALREAARKIDLNKLATLKPAQP